MSYLPLSYLAAQLFDMWLSISVAGALYFAQPDALRVSGAPRSPAVVGASEVGGGWPGGVHPEEGALSPELESPLRPPQLAVQPWSFSLGLSFLICEGKGLEQT